MVRRTGNAHPLSILATSTGGALLLAAVVVTSCPHFDPVSSPLPQSWGLPRDIDKSLGQLKELGLPSAVDRLDWLPAALEKLDAAGTRIKSLRGLPPSLLELDVSFTELTSIAGVPEGLASLDLRGTRVAHLAHLPASLKTLGVSGSHIHSLGQLPSSLGSLWLEQTEIHDLSALPAHLTALKLSGPSFDNLDGLPQALTSLALWGTKVKSLRKLPRSIQNLELVANTDLRIAAEDLPPLLTRLTIDEQSTPDLTGLKYLDWLSDRSSKPSGKWPLSLSSLTVRASNLEELPPFPPSLRALGLLHTALSPFAKLPPEIEDLSLIDYRGPQIEGLPRGLKRLNLSFSSNLKTVPELPRDLEELDLTGTTVTDLRGLPPTIRRLVFRGFPLRELRGLADQLPNLETLDVSESPRLEVIDALPTRLLTLNVSRTGITSLPQLPPCLHALALSEVVSLEHLPKELRALRFVSRAAP